MSYEQLTRYEHGVLDSIQQRIDTIYSSETDIDTRAAIKSSLDYIDELYREVKSEPSSEKAEQIIKDIATYLSILDNPNEALVPRSNIEMLAAERLLRITTHVTDPSLVKLVIDCIIQYAATSRLGAGRDYYLSLLYHFTSQSNYERIEQHIVGHTIEGEQHIVGDAFKEISPESLYNPQSDGYLEMARGVQKYRSAIAALAEEKSDLLTDDPATQSKTLRRYVRTIKYIINDFAETDEMPIEERDEINTAKLLAHYYEKDYERDTSDPSFSEDILLRNVELGRTTKEGGGSTPGHENADNEAWMFVSNKVGLPPHQWPTQEKINEAKNLDDALTDFRVVNREEYYNQDIRDFTTLNNVPPLNDARGEILYQQIRHAKDKRDPGTEASLKKDLYEAIWEHIEATDKAAAKAIGSIDNMLVLAYTIRNTTNTKQSASETAAEFELV